MANTEKKENEGSVDFKHIVLAILIGSTIGYILPNYGIYFSSIGTIYISLIQLCVIPIILITVVRSFEKVTRKKASFPRIGKVFSLFLAGSLAACLLGLALGYIFKPGHLGTEDRMVIGKTLSQNQESPKNHVKNNEEISFLDLVSKIVPSNIFESMSKGNIASIIIFSVLFGITLGSLPSPSVRVLNNLFNVIYDAFFKLAERIIKFLPIGVFFILAGEISLSGYSIIRHSLILLIVMYAALLTLVIFYTFLMKLCTGASFLGVLKGLKDSLIIAFSAASEFVAMPVALRCLQNNLKANKFFSELTFPIGLSISPQGSVAYIAISVMTFSQMFDIHLGLQGYLITILGSMVFATSIIGIPGAVVSLAPLYVSLGIPPEIAIAILMTIDPFLDQFHTLSTIHANCGMTIIAEKVSLGHKKNDIL